MSNKSESNATNDAYTDFVLKNNETGYAKFLVNVNQQLLRMLDLPSNYVQRGIYTIEDVENHKNKLSEIETVLEWHLKSLLLGASFEQKNRLLKYFPRHHSPEGYLVISRLMEAGIYI
jgi:hypothetical protein